MSSGKKSLLPWLQVRWSLRRKRRRKPGPGQWNWWVGNLRFSKTPWFSSGEKIVRNYDSFRDLHMYSSQNER
jgi:hypothetical protein